MYSLVRWIDVDLAVAASLLLSGYVPVFSGSGQRRVVAAWLRACFTVVPVSGGLLLSGFVPVFQWCRSAASCCCLAMCLFFSGAGQRRVVAVWLRACFQWCRSEEGLSVRRDGINPSLGLRPRPPWRGRPVLPASSSSSPDASLRNLANPANCRFSPVPARYLPARRSL